MNRRTSNRQSGVALLTAMLVVTIATVLAVNLLWQTGVSLQRTENLLLQDQARQYGLGGEELARFLLADDIRINGLDGTDTRSEWEAPLFFPVDGGSLEGFLADQQGRFDLNSLVDREGRPVPFTQDQYRRLLTLLPLEIPMDPGTAAALTEATIDWLDPDQTPMLEGAEDDRYTGRQPPYRPANFWFVSPSELMAVEGYTADLYRALEPHVTALPPATAAARRALNVNSATNVVLASLLNQSVERIEVLASQEFESVEEFQQAALDDIGPDALADVPPDAFDIRSSWFLLTVTASIGSVQSTMYSLLERDGENVRSRLRSFEAR